MRLSVTRSIAAWLGILALGTPIARAASPQEDPATETARRRTVFKTALFGLAPQGVMVVRALEARRGAAESRLQVVFLNERDEVVKRETQSFAPGKPARFSVSQAELGTDGDFPAVRAEMVLTQGGSESELFLNVEFHNLGTLTVEERGPFCSPPEGSRLQPNCSGGIGVFPNLEGS
jgi:hypothetical protein